MAIRGIDGPDGNHLDMSDLVKLMCLSETAIRRLIKNGLFPEATDVPGAGKKWLWSDVVFWQLYVGLRSRINDQEPPGTARDRQGPPNSDRDGLED